MSSSSDVQQDIVSSLLTISKYLELEEDKERKAVTCPHCESSAIRANGKLKGVQHYLCNGCSKNFSETTGKFWFVLEKKDKINKYLYCLLSGCSIRKSAKETGISIQPSFDWRHKLLSSFSSVSVDEFEGIVESYDLFFPISEKGNLNLERKPKKRGKKASKVGVSDEKVAVIATYDRCGNKDFKVSTTGRISKKHLNEVYQGKLEKVTVLCNDSHSSYGAFTKESSITHKKSVCP